MRLNHTYMRHQTREAEMRPRQEPHHHLRMMVCCILPAGKLRPCVRGEQTLRSLRADLADQSRIDRRYSSCISAALAGHVLDATHPPSRRTHGFKLDVGREGHWHTAPLLSPEKVRAFGLRRS